VALGGNTSACLAAGACAYVRAAANASAACVAADAAACAGAALNGSAAACLGAGACRYAPAAVEHVAARGAGAIRWVGVALLTAPYVVIWALMFRPLWLGVKGGYTLLFRVETNETTRVVAACLLVLVGAGGFGALLGYQLSSTLLK